MNNTLDDMLDDAKILAEYGWRSGQLKNARLFEAIAAFENLGSRTWKAPETANLQDALNEAIVAMAPTTLSDIKLRNPFAASTRPETIKRIALIAFSILLMVLTARFTILYNEGNELAGLFNKISEDKPAEKMAAVARQWRISVKTDEDSNNETYFRMLDEVRELDRQVREYNTGYPAYRERVNWPWNDVWRYFWAPAVDARNNLPQVSCSMPVPPPPASPPPSVVEAAPPASGEPPAAQSALPAAEQPAQQAGSAPPQGPPASPPPPADFGSKAPGLYLKQNKELIASFACMESLEITPYAMHAMVKGHSEIQGIIKLLGLWLLPGFYGALGATISYMRAILNPVLPDPPMERIVHRIALGGFAGIIFAWFWAPSPDAAQQFVGLTINSFAVAFIIGFSIDVLFALLDTVVRFLQGIVNQIGQASAGPAPAAAGGAPRPVPAQPQPPRPAAVVQSIAPSAITRAAAPAVLKLSGKGLDDVRAVSLSNGAAIVAATGVKASATSVTFTMVLDETQPAGDWKVEVTDAAGASIAVPDLLAVT